MFQSQVYILQLGIHLEEPGMGIAIFWPQRQVIVQSCPHLDLAERLRDLASSRGLTSAQLALAWLLHREGDIVPLFGTRRRGRIDENVAAVDVRLAAEDLARLEEWFRPGAAAGARYPEAAMRRVEPMVH